MSRRNLDVSSDEMYKPKPIRLKRGQTIGLVTSRIVMQEEKGQTPVERNPSSITVEHFHRTLGHAQNKRTRSTG